MKSLSPVISPAHVCRLDPKLSRLIVNLDVTKPAAIVSVQKPSHAALPLLDFGSIESPSSAPLPLARLDGEGHGSAVIEPGLARERGSWHAVPEAVKRSRNHGASPTGLRPADRGCRVYTRV